MAIDPEELKAEVERCLSFAEPPPDVKQLYETIANLSYNLAAVRSNLHYYEARWEEAEHALKLLKRRVHRLSADI